MIRKRLVICDTDIRYLHRIQDYLMKKDLNDFEIEVFEQLEQAIEDSQKHAFEITLIGENIFQQEKATQIESKQIFILKETAQSITESYPCLDKYQSIEQLINQILEDYTKQVGERIVYKRKRRAKVISFYSATKTTEQTIYAYAASQVLAKMRYKVLYINIQPYTGLEILLQLEGNRDLTDLIYYALQHSDRFTSKLDTMKYNRGGVDILPTIRKTEDLLAMTKEDWKEWLEVMVYTSGYEILVLDYVGTMSFSQDFLKCSDLIYYIKGITFQEKACDEEFMRILEKKDWSTVKNGIREVEGKVGEVKDYEALYLSQLGIYMKQELVKERIIYAGTEE